MRALPLALRSALVLSAACNGSGLADRVQGPDGSPDAKASLAFDAADTGEFPAIASIRTPGHSCAGVLVGSEWVLTTATCVAGESDLSVVVGNDHAYGGTPLPVHEVRLFPGEYWVDARFDAALVRIPATGIQPVEVVDYSTPRVMSGPGVEAIAPGWGAWVGTSPELWQSRAPILDGATCAALYADQGIGLPADPLCAGHVDTYDTCSGDPGGPLFVEIEPGRKMLVGLDLGGIGCAPHGLPGFYNRVDRLGVWLELNVPDIRFVSETEPPAGTTDDHGDSFVSATPLTLSSAPVEATLEPGDVDVFWVWMAPGDTLVVRSYSGIDPMLAVYDASGNLLVANDDALAGSGSSNPRDFAAEVTTTEGNGVYLEVAGWQGQQDGPYVLEVRPGLY